MAENEKKDDAEELVSFVVQGVGSQSTAVPVSMTRAEYDSKIAPFETAETPGRQDLNSRIKMIHMLTNIIEGSDITRIDDRDDAAMLAVAIVDGIADEAERHAARISGRRPGLPELP